MMSYERTQRVFEKCYPSRARTDALPPFVQGGTEGRRPIWLALPPSNALPPFVQGGTEGGHPSRVREETLAYRCRKTLPYGRVSVRPGPSYTRSPLRLGLVVLAVAFGTGGARAADDDKIDVRILTIRATRANQEVSPELKPLVKALQSSFTFSGYKLVKAESHTVALNKGVTTSLTGPFKAEVSPTGRADGKIKLKVTVTQRENERDVKKLDTVVSLPPERFQLFGGWKLDKDDVLIVAVSAK